MEVLELLFIIALASVLFIIAPSFMEKHPELMKKHT